MSARRNFLRNITMAIAASLVPRILQPAIPELPEMQEEEKYVLNIQVLLYQPLTSTDCFEISEYKLEVNKKTSGLSVYSKVLGYKTT